MRALNREMRAAICSKDDSLFMQKHVPGCPKESFSRIVLGNGNLDARLMVIGSHPDRDEHKGGTAFCGSVGNTIQRLLREQDIDPDSVFSTTLIKLFIARRNAWPTPEEIKRHGRWLLREIAIVQPDVILVLGRVPFHFLAYFLKHGVLPIPDEHAKSFDIKKRNAEPIEISTTRFRFSLVATGSPKKFKANSEWNGPIRAAFAVAAQSLRCVPNSVARYFGAPRQRAATSTGTTSRSSAVASTAVAVAVVAKRTQKRDRQEVAAADMPSAAKRRRRCLDGPVAKDVHSFFFLCAAPPSRSTV